MGRNTISGIALLIMFAVLRPAVRATETDVTQKTVDICVYGSTPAGIMAAYTARLKGKSVLLVSPTKRIGGMTAGGLGWTDIGDSTSHRRIIKGFAREFYRRIGNHYGIASPQFYFEPKVALATFEGFLSEAGIRDGEEMWRQWRIVKANKESNALVSIELESCGDIKGTMPNRTVYAKIFMDCSYEGDLMARAGVSYTVGREPASQYGEPENGVQMLNKHQFTDGVDPYVVKGNPASGLLWGIQEGSVGTKGAGDNHIQAYNYRVTLSKKNFRPITDEIPDNYDPSRYELLFRWLEKKGWSGTGDCLKWSYMKDSSGPNSWNAYKTDNNNNGAFSTDMIGYSWDYPEATYEQRDSIAKLHEDYTKGLLYILWTDPRVPKNIQSEYLNWGYPLDEYTDNHNFTPQLYIREARRMIGRLVMTEDYCLRTKEANDPIAWGAYTMDSHNCGRYVVNGMVKNEGDVQRHLTAGPYNISYRSVTPRESEAKNLLVPVCLSASHIAYGSIRMEPVYMVLGETTALAAVQAIDEHDCRVQAVDASRCISQLEGGLQIDSLETLPATNNTVAVDITSRVLQNPSFEIAFNQNTLPPAGWSEAPAGLTLQRSISTAANNKDGQQTYVCKPATGGTIVEPLKLYQRVPSEKLGAGIYKISCRMWVEKDYYGTSCLFADNGDGTNCNVQYWTTEAYYRNASSGYDALTYTDYRSSFAGHAGGFNNIKTQNLQRMTVYINLREGDDLVLGVRTNSSNQGVDKAGAGYFMVDDFRVEKVTERADTPDSFSEKNLVNYNFEKDPKGVTYDWNQKTTKNEASNGTIFGWQSNAWTDSYGGVSDAANLELKWAGWVGSTAVIPNDFRLFQIIPAERLTPGVYEVSGRMWVYYAKLGLARLYGAAGDKCSVQYYGSKERYPNLLTEGEVATFANLNANTTTGRVSELSLDIEVGEGENLEVGVKSGYGAETNKQNGQNHGKFYIDQLRTWKVSDLPVTYEATAADNQIVPRSYTNRVVLNRQFLNGVWNTVCLPFALNAADIRTIFGAGTQVMEFSEVKTTGPDDENWTMKWTEVDEMRAGVPYAVRPTDVLAAPITLEHVQISVSEPSQVKVGDVTLHGTFGMTTLSSDATACQLDDSLQPQPSAESVPAFSAYVTREGTSLRNVEADTESKRSDATYDLLGRPAPTAQRGVAVQKGRKFLKK